MADTTSSGPNKSDYETSHKTLSMARVLPSRYNTYMFMHLVTMEACSNK